jgi:hypothetical protein
LPLFLLRVLCALCVEIRKAQRRVRRGSQRTTKIARTLQMRGTSGTPRRTKRSRYRCSLPGLAGFAGLRRTEPEVPRIGSRAIKVRLQRKSSTASLSKKNKTRLSARTRTTWESSAACCEGRLSFRVVVVRGEMFWRNPVLVTSTFLLNGSTVPLRGRSWFLGRCGRRQDGRCDQLFQRSVNRA